MLNNCKSDWIELHQGVPQGTILGPLLFNIYVNRMKEYITEKCELIQYADDTMIFSANTNEKKALKNLEENIKKVKKFFEIHRLTINGDKTEFITSCKISKNNIVRDMEIQVDGKTISPSNHVKCLGVFLNQNLTYQNEVKNLLMKMACGIKTIYSVRDLFPEKSRFLLLNALVISHLHYSLVLLNGITENLLTTFENQLRWAVKACFNRNKFDHSSDLKIYHKILPIRYFLQYKSILYFWKFRPGILPAFAKVKPTTAVIKNQERTNKLYVNLPRETEVMRNCFYNKVVPLWNTSPDNVNIKNYTYVTMKRKIKSFFQKFENEIDTPGNSKKCWNDFRFT